MMIDVVGWVMERGEGHEGWVANVLADGRVAGEICSDGVLVAEATPHDLLVGRATRQLPGGGGLMVLLPWDEVTAWQVRCDCGWTGSRQPAHDADDEPGYRGCDSRPDVEAAFRREWTAHAAPEAIIDDIGRLRARITDLHTGLDTAVHLARTAGLSWARIGAAAGITAQGAQQRWNHSKT